MSTPLTDFSTDGEAYAVPLAHVYWCGVMFEMMIGFFFLCWGTATLVGNMKSLPFLVKSFLLVLISDWWLCINFFFRDWHNMNLGHLEVGMWCTLSGFMAIFTSLGCRMYFGVFAFVAYRYDDDEEEEED